MGRKGPPLQHAVKVDGLGGLVAPVQRQGCVTQAKRGEMEGVPPLGDEVVLVGWRPGAALVKGDVGLVEVGAGTGAGQQDRPCGGALTNEALNGTRADAAVAADAVECPVLFLKILISLAAVEV